MAGKHQVFWADIQGEGGFGSRRGDTHAGPGPPDSTIATRLRTVLAIAQHEGGLDAVDRLLGRIDEPPQASPSLN